MCENVNNEQKQEVMIAEPKQRALRPFQMNNARLIPGTPVDAQMIDFIEYLAMYVVRSSFLPESLIVRQGGKGSPIIWEATKANAFLVMYGAHVRGLDCIASLPNFSCVNGKVEAWGDLLTVLIRRCEGFVDMDIVFAGDDDPNKLDALRCTVTGKRLMRPPVGEPYIKEVVGKFSYAHAKREGLLGKDNWKTHPETMTMRRAVKNMARILFPEALSGFTADEPEPLLDGVIDVSPADVSGKPSAIELADAALASIAAPQSPTAPVSGAAEAPKRQRKAKPEAAPVADVAPPHDPEPVPDVEPVQEVKPVAAPEVPAPETTTRVTTSAGGGIMIERDDTPGALPMGIDQAQIERDYRSQIGGARSATELGDIAHRLGQHRGVDADTANRVMLAMKFKRQTEKW